MTYDVNNKNKKTLLGEDFGDDLFLENRPLASTVMSPSSSHSINPIQSDQKFK